MGVIYVAVAMQLQNIDGVLTDLTGNTVWSSTSGTMSSDLTGPFGSQKAIGIRQAVFITNSASVTKLINPAEDMWTLSLWINMSGVTSSLAPYVLTSKDNYNGLILTVGSLKLTFTFRFTHDWTQDVDIDIGTPSESWCHVAIVSDGSGTWKCFVNGTSVYTSTRNLDLTSGLRLGTSGRDAGYVDDVCIIDGEALWTDNFTPPTGYLFKTQDKMLFRGINNKVYGNNAGLIDEVVSDWSILTDQQKAEAFSDYGVSSSDSLDLSPIPQNFSVLLQTSSSSVPTLNLNAIPNAQIIIPKQLVYFNKLKSMSVTVNQSSSGQVRLAVTKNLLDYYVYSNNEWVHIDVKDITSDGMTVSQISSISASAWADFNADSIGVAYSLSMESITDALEVDELSVVVDLMGEVQSQVQGVDYDYGYSAKNTLRIKFYKSGNFKINYPDIKS